MDKPESEFTVPDGLRDAYTRGHPMSDVTPAHTPALTAEQWDARFVESQNGYVVDDRTQHAIAALCLHGQSFGFRWEDVDALRDWAEWMGRHGPWSVGINGTSYNAEFPASIADRIQALLPPRQP